MAKIKNLKGEELQEVIDNINFEPNSNYLLVTVNEVESENGLEMFSETELSLDEWQYVIASGPRSPYRAGDKVYLNLNKLVKRVPDPTDRTKLVEQITIIPYPYKNYMLTFLDDNSILGKLGTDTINLKA